MISQEDIDAFADMEAGSHPPPILTAEEFDRRAEAGEDLSAYFSHYAPCNLTLEKLFEELFSALDNDSLIA